MCASRSRSETRSSSARHYRRSRGAIKGKIRFRWRLAGAPTLSRYDHRLLGAGGGGTTQGLGSPSRARTWFRPEVPGTYRPSVTVSGGGSSRRELVDVEAVPGPLVALDTMAQQNGSRGIRVGAAFYPAGSGDLQVLVLQRATLGMRSNTTYACAADPSGCAARIATDLKSLDDAYLVIASAQPTFAGGWVSLVPHGALAAIGVASPPAPTAAGGYFSAVGFPGLSAGKATTNAPTPAEVKLGSDTTGALRGFLTPDRFGNYGYISPERIPFDTRVPGSDENTVAVTVGSQSFFAIRSNDYGGGFMVVCVSRENPNVVYDEDRFYTDQPDIGLSDLAVQEMADFLANRGEIICTPDPARTLIVISSFGEPYLPPAVQQTGPCGAADWTCLAEVIGQIGGTEQAPDNSNPTGGGLGLYKPQFLLRS